MVNSMIKRLLVSGLLAGAVGFCQFANASPNLIANGDFSLSFADWLYGDTVNGSLGLNLPTIESFDTTGDGASAAAKFEVGQTTSDGMYEGGVLYQQFTVTTAGEYTLFANAASSDTTALNGAGGFFQLAVDNTIVDSWHSGKVLDDQVLRRTLEGTTYLTAGEHTLAIFMRRPYLEIPNATPFQYIDNVAVSAVPEPKEYALLLIGIGLLGLGSRLRRRHPAIQSSSLA